MSTNYHKGRYYEYKVKKQLEQQGYYVVRSAGSHTLFDLIAINPKTSEVLLIQVKKKPTKKDKDLYGKVSKWFDGSYRVRTLLMDSNGNKYNFNVQ